MLKLSPMMGAFSFLQKRLASHSVMSSRPCIPRPPKQPQKEYFIDYNPPGGLQGWTDWRMKKDARKRKNIVKWGPTYTLLKAMKKTTILPREITEVAVKDLHNLPKEFRKGNTMIRCAVSSRYQGIILRWRLSRFFFRHMADYNQLSGVRRAMW